MFNYKNFIPIIEYNALVFYLFILVLELCVCAILDNIFTCMYEHHSSCPVYDVQTNDVDRNTGSSIYWMHTIKTPAFLLCIYFLLDTFKTKYVCYL